MTLPALARQYPGVGVVSANNLNTYVQGSPTVAYLRGFADADTYQMVQVLGTSAPGGTGTGTFYWDPTNPGPDDGINLIVPNGATIGAWVRVPIPSFLVSVVTQNQMRLWGAANGSPLYVYQIDNACPSDIADPVNIGWLHAPWMTLGDDLYDFIQSTLGFSGAQMLAAFADMQSYPP